MYEYYFAFGIKMMGYWPMIIDTNIIAGRKPRKMVTKFAFGEGGGILFS